MYRLRLIVTFTLPQWQTFLGFIAGGGGGQLYVRRVQSIARSQYERTGRYELTIDGEDVETWFRYRNQYGDGGFQQRLGRGQHYALRLVVMMTEPQWHAFHAVLVGTDDGHAFVRRLQRQAMHQSAQTRRHELAIEDGDVDKWFEYRDDDAKPGTFQARLGRTAQQQQLLT